MPVFSQLAWQGLTPLIPHALVPAELVATTAMYGRLATLALLRNELATMVDEKPVLYTMPDGYGGQIVQSSTPELFRHHGIDMWDRLEALVTALQSDGNPLAENTMSDQTRPEPS